MPQIGSSVVIRCRADEYGPESFLLGGVVETVARHPSGSHSLHVVEPKHFKHSREEEWGRYTGVPQVLARFVRGKKELEWVDQWPRRGRS